MGLFFFSDGAFGRFQLHHHDLSVLVVQHFLVKEKEVGDIVQTFDTGDEVFLFLRGRIAEEFIPQLFEDIADLFIRPEEIKVDIRE